MSEDQKKMHRFVANPPNAAARQVVEKLKADEASESETSSPYWRIAPGREAYREVPTIDGGKIKPKR